MWFAFCVCAHKIWRSETQFRTLAMHLFRLALHPARRRCPTEWCRSWQDYDFELTNTRVICRNGMVLAIFPIYPNVHRKSVDSEMLAPLMEEMLQCLRVLLHLTWLCCCDWGCGHAVPLPTTSPTPPVSSSSKGQDIDICADNWGVNDCRIWSIIGGIFFGLYLWEALAKSKTIR